MLPVGDHLDLLSRQFLTQVSVDSHPSHSVISGVPGPRSHRHTLSSKHGAAVAPFLHDGIISFDNLRDLHSVAVACTVRHFAQFPNKVLGAHAPEVDVSEATLLGPGDPRYAN